MQGSTPDHAKWAGVNSFARTYCNLATQYVALTGDQAVKIYDTSNLKNTFETVWPDQKRLFDTIYIDTLMLFNVLTQTEEMSTGPLYNLFVSGLSEAWAGEPFQLELSRCIREYTTRHLTDRYGSLDAASVAELRRAPCIFAYETGCKLAPKFGYIREIVLRQGQVRVEYELHQVKSFLTADDLEQMTFELDVEPQQVVLG